MNPPGPPWPDQFAALVYELLDAHQDTLELARDLPQASWRAHLEYLRALQRKGREQLARLDAAAPPSAAEASR